MKEKSKGISDVIIVLAILSLIVVNILSMAKIRDLEKKLNYSGLAASRSQLSTIADSKIKDLWEMVSAHQKWLELNASNLKEINEMVNKNFDEIFSIIKKQRDALSGS
ncbi:MAG: hypothetical protein JW867_00300 [Candidatus Omnitrophica bacterium]|nr:hypothetical protein [Candidatus Omnitrophota bacterium]